MKNRFEKLMAILLTIVMTISIIGAIPVYAAPTQSSVVSWMSSKNGTTINDGGTQCVAAFNSYLRLFGYSSPISMYPVVGAREIFDYNAPSGWQKISGSSSFQVGDVVIWNGNVGGGYGHVGLVYSTSGGTVQIFDQNWVSKNVCGIHTISSVSSIRGVFRPPFGSNNFPGEEDTSWNVPVWKTANSYLNTYDDSGIQESNHNIDAGDNCYIEKVYKNGFVHVKYPTPSGDRWAYAKASGFSLEKKGSGSHDPIGVVDAIEGGAGNVHVRGWAFDPDTTNKSLEIHVYIGGLAENSSSEGHGGIMANTERTDVNNVYGCGNNHGFDVTLSTSKRGSQAVYVYTFDTTTDENFVIGSKTITISEPLKTYTISYNANGGTAAPASQTKTQGTDLTLSTTKPTRTGYTFLGWATNKDATTATYAAGGKYTTNAAATLYAVWKANTYTINYNANGGSGAPANQTKTYGTDLTLSSTIPTKTGYTFLGWATSSTATTATYSASDKYTANAAATLYAVWKANTYTISYNANGGSGAPASQTKTYGIDLTLSNTIPTRTGYTFLGWATSSTATTATYSAGGKYTVNASATLYAVWKANSFRITYMVNGNIFEDSYISGSTSAIIGIGTSTIPTRTGYKLIGWSTSPSATTVTYRNGDRYTSGKDIVLYAVWEKEITILLGDVNNDGDIDFADATLILQVDAGMKTLTADQKTAADVNKDGDVDFADATLVLQYDSGKIKSF